MPNYDFKCLECLEETVINISYKDRDTLLSCPSCLADKGLRRFYGKMPSTPTASLLDGQKRPGWEELKIEAKLDLEAAKMDKGSEDAKELRKEQDERASRIKKT